MGNFIVKALLSLVKGIVVLVLSILTLAFLFVADMVALVLYPVWVWRNPCNASEVRFLSDVLNWQFLDDIVNSHHRVVDNKFLEFCQAILRPFDAMVVRFWNAAFLHCAPMKKRKFFIDQLGNSLQKLPVKVQVKYFKAVDFDRRVYLLKNNMLSSVVPEKIYTTYEVEFVYAGKLTDKQFRELGIAHLKLFCSMHDLNMQKQEILVLRAIQSPDSIASILSAYIMRRGLHPLAVQKFYEYYNKPEKTNLGLNSVIVALECRQDLVTVQQTNAVRNTVDKGEVFSAYLKQRGKLGYEAQVAMSSWQYELYHQQDHTLTPKAVYEKLARVNKNNDSELFVRLMMRYGEVNDEIALHQIAGDEKLSALWLANLKTA